MTELFYRNECMTASVLASIILGVITAALGFTGIITVAYSFYWVAFGIAAGFLGLILLISPFVGNECVSCVLSAVFTGIVGTVITSLVLLATNPAVTTVAGAALTGILLAFLILIITSVTCLIKRII